MFIFTATIATLAIFFLGFLVFLRNKNSPVNRAFFGIAFSIALWIMSNFFIDYFFNSYNGVLFWGRMAFISASFIAIFVFYFCLSFPENKSIPRPYRLLIVFPILLSVFSHLIVVGVQDINVYPRTLIYGYFHYFFALYFITFVLVSFITIFKKFKRVSGKRKAQLLYVIFGFFIGLLIGMTTNLFLPLLGHQEFSHLAPLSVTIFVSLNTYAIVRHRLWDIRLVLVKSLTFSLIIVSLASLFIFIVYFVSDYFSSSFNISTNTTFVVAGLVIAFGFAPFKRLIERLTNNLFYKKRYNPSLVLKKLTEIMRSTLGLETLTKSILSTLKEEMRLERIGLLLINQDSKKKDKPKAQSPRLRAQSPKPRASIMSLFGWDKDLSYQDKLVNLIINQDILVTDELPDPNQDKEFLRKQEIAVLIPLKLEKRLLGILILSEKKSGDMYSLQDINFLILLSSQLSVACNNSLSFDEVVRDREKIKRLLKEREELDKMKDEFIAIASHEVNTPLSIAQGYLSLVLEGTAGKLEPKVKNFLTKAYEGIHRINFLLSALMNASKIEQGKLVAQKARVNLNYLCKESVRIYLPYAKKRHIELEYQKPKESPYVLCDPKLIKEVLNSLISNALKFIPKTRKGKVTVSLERKDNQILVSVKDNGIGIDKKKLPHLFEKFFQEDTSFTRATQGAGLGLYLTQSFLKLHNSKIEVKTEKGKGSEFWFGLEVVK